MLLPLLALNFIFEQQIERGYTLYLAFISKYIYKTECVCVQFNATHHILTQRTTASAVVRTKMTFAQGGFGGFTTLCSNECSYFKGLHLRLV